MIVIFDKSALQARGRAPLHAAAKKHCVLLPEVLKHEIQSGERHKWPNAQWDSIVQSPGGWERPSLVALTTWEMENGRSAAGVNIPYDYPPILPPDEYDEAIGALVRQPLSAKNQQLCREARSKGRSLKDTIQDCIRPPEFREACMNFYRCNAPKRGIRLHPCFDPQVGWFCHALYKMVAALRVLRGYKWGPNDKLPERDIEHYSFDMEYIAHLVEADVYVSDDTVALDVAQACWPGKRIWTVNEFNALEPNGGQASL